MTAPAQTDALPLTAVRRGALLPLAARLARLEALAPSLASLVEGERDPIALMATFAACLHAALPQSTWTGFYRRSGADALVIGPYQGGVGCLRIDGGRGVCGACLRSGAVQRVDDVRRRADHIACDAATRSELVLPVVDGRGGVRAVLDLDAHRLAAYSDAEAAALVGLLAGPFATANWSYRDRS